MVVNGAPAEPQSHALSEPAGECETLPTIIRVSTRMGGCLLDGVGRLNWAW